MFLIHRRTSIVLKACREGCLEAAIGIEPMNKGFCSLKEAVLLSMAHFDECSNKPCNTLVHCPQRQRRDVFYENPITGNCRLGPSRAVCHVILFQRLKSFSAASRNDQFGIVVQQEEELVRLDDCGVCRLTGRTQPQDLAGFCIESKKLT